METEDVAFENARPFTDIPKIPFLEVALRMRKENASGKLRTQVVFGEYFKKFNSSIVRFKVPFLGHQLVFEDPEAAKAMLINDGKNPIEPGFDFFVNYRHHRKDLFPKDTGNGANKINNMIDFKYAIEICYEV